MKTKITLLYILLVLFKNLSSQTSTHPTIESVKVSYKYTPISTPTPTVSSVANMQVIPEAIIVLKNQVNISNIIFKIQDIASGAFIYNVSYNINSPQLTVENKKLFENSNGTIFISSGIPILLKPYTIKVQTLDTLQNSSTIFSLIQ